MDRAVGKGSPHPAAPMSERQQLALIKKLEQQEQQLRQQQLQQANGSSGKFQTYKGSSTTVSWKLGN